MTSSFTVWRAMVAAASIIILASCGPAKPAADAAPAPFAPLAASLPAVAASSEPAGQATSSVQDLMAATVIHWSVVGDFEGDALILNVGTNGYAPVTDHVAFAYDFTLEGNTGLAGTPTFANFPSTMGALRNGAEGCRAPTSAPPPYEHWTIEKIEEGLGGTVALTVRTNFPEGQVPVACTGGNQASPAHATTTQVDLPIPSIAYLMMGDQLTGDVQLSKDKHSIIYKSGGWTYAFAPRKVR